VGPVELGLTGHDVAHRGAGRDAVHRAGEVERALHLPQLVVPVRREEPGRVSGGDPADRDDRPRRQSRIGVQHAVDPQFRAGAGDRTGKQPGAGRHEHLVLDGGPVDVRVRADQDRVAEDDRVVRPAPHQRALHDHDLGAGADLAVLRGQDGAVQHARPLTEHDRATQHRRRRDIGRFRNHGSPAAMFEQHCRSLRPTR
jgi:hypothetical protein